MIEDHPDSARMRASLLQGVGCHTRTAETFGQALDAAGNEIFDVVLSDLALPDGTGYPLIDKLPHDVPVIAISGLGPPRDRQRSVNAGFVEHLVKPVTLAALIAAIGRAVAKEP